MIDYTLISATAAERIAIERIDSSVSLAPLNRDLARLVALFGQKASLSQFAFRTTTSVFDGEPVASPSRAPEHGPCVGCSAVPFTLFGPFLTQYQKLSG